MGRSVVRACVLPAPTQLSGCLIAESGGICWIERANGTIEKSILIERDFG